MINSKIEKKLFEYPESHNTAFLKISSPDYDDNFYINDDLINDKEYKNDNRAWRKYYNACLVVPIRRSLIKAVVQTQDYDIVGFLCVDNKGGRLNNKTSIEILSMLGDSLYCLFYMHSLIRSPKKEV